MPAVWSINTDSWDIDKLLSLLEEERLNPQASLPFGSAGVANGDAAAEDETKMKSKFLCKSQ